LAQLWGTTVRSHGLAIEGTVVHGAEDGWQFDAVAQESDLLEGHAGRDVAVVDGLAALSNCRPVPGGSAFEITAQAEQAAVRTARLLGGACVRSARMPDERPVRVAEIHPVAPARVRAPHWTDPGTEVNVRPAGLLGEARRGLAHEDIVILPPQVSIAPPRLRDLPQSRRQVALHEIRSRDQEAFLKEAERSRRVPSGRGELVAVFRRVPVELITRARYSEASGGLIYTLAVPPGRSRTRVHDVGAVRDATSGKVHLVPHRTQFSEAVLP
jgi:hypothetical protein